MATTYAEPTRVVAPSAADSFRKTVEIWSNWWNARRAMNRVRNLDDRLLTDIGLMRSDVGLPEHEIAVADLWWQHTMLDSRKSDHRGY